MLVPVCDGEDCASLELLPDGGLDQVVRLKINSRRGLVENENLEKRGEYKERPKHRHKKVPAKFGEGSSVKAVLAVHWLP